jgi:hypothetical protein
MRTASARADRRMVLVIALSRERFVVAAQELQELFADGRTGEAVGLSVALARDVRNGEVE